MGFSTMEGRPAAGELADLTTLLSMVRAVEQELDPCNPHGLGQGLFWLLYKITVGSRQLFVC